MFSMREYVKKGFLNAVGKQPDYWIILNSVGYAEKGILLQDDLAEIQAKIDEQYNVTENIEEEIEENIENV